MSAVNEATLPLSVIVIEESLTTEEGNEFTLTESENNTEKVIQKAFRLIVKDQKSEIQTKLEKPPLTHQLTPLKPGTKTKSPCPKKKKKPPEDQNKQEFKGTGFKQKPPKGSSLYKSSYPRVAQEIRHILSQNNKQISKIFYTLLPRPSTQKPFNLSSHTPKGLAPKQNKNASKELSKELSKMRPCPKHADKKRIRERQNTTSSPLEKFKKSNKFQELVAQKHPLRDEEREQKHKRDKGVLGVQANKKKSAISPSSLPFSKPILDRPKMGLFPLYYLLDKLGLASEANQYRFAKQEVSDINAKMKEFFKLKIEAMKQAIEQEKSTARWGILQQVISWIASAISIVLGITLILSGGGAIAGALLIAGGLITITSQIMQLTGGWKKITEILPGDDPEKKRAVITWIQIGIAVLSLVLGGVGLVVGGFSAISESMANVMRLIGAIAAIGGGVSAIGVGINEYLFKNKLADVKEYELKLAILRHRREDLLDLLENGLDRLKRLYEMLCDNLGLEEEVFLSHQIAWK